jgi:lactate dehydrogenase-like 2-hydroxyacid dehydrogenase
LAADGSWKRITAALAEEKVMSVQTKILVVGKIPPFFMERLRAIYDCHHIFHPPVSDDILAVASEIRAIVGTGEALITRALLDSLPAVKIVAISGVGYDGVDVKAAREKDVIVTHTPNVLTDDVADLGLGLLLSVARAIPEADRFVRSGQWVQGPFRFTRKLGGARLGIVGLGRIGRAVAKRAEAFGMKISYCGRRPVAEVPYPFFEHPAKLAANVDFLMVVTPGGAATRGLIDAQVLSALGPKGYLINIARGSVVDQDALLAALESGHIAGAALDVFADEPNVPSVLFGRDNVVLTPHMASGTAETRSAMADLVFANLDAYFSGRPVPTPIPTDASRPVKDGR